MWTARLCLLALLLLTTSAGMLPWPAAAQPGPVVIVAPHPDDETLGCGGLIARRAAEGRRIVVVVITDGRAELIFLDVENERLIEQQAEATRRVTALLKDLAPAELYVTSPFEGHREHLASGGRSRSSAATSTSSRHA